MPKRGTGLDSAALASFSLQLTRTRHDLRGCVGQILGFSELLLEDAAEACRHALQVDLHEIQQVAAHMIAQINDGLGAHKVMVDLGHLPSLQTELCAEAARILSLAEGLKIKADSGETEFREDLDRIIGAARQATELAGNSLTFLFKPTGKVAAFPEPLHPYRVADWSTASSTHLPAAELRKEGMILVVDDLEENRELLRRRLARLGYEVVAVESGLRALEVVREQPPDLILLDILMPELDGFGVLQRLKQDAATRHIPIVMLSSADELDVVVRCISLGADDFLPKPFNPTLLMARIESSLTKKRLRDQEVAFLKRLQAEQEISERLLLNILPQPIAERLKQGEKTIADSFSEVTVLFSDFVGFTRMSAGMPARLLVEHLNRIFSRFDQLCEQHGLEKIKMIGDAYMAVAGLPTPRDDNAAVAANLALDMQLEVDRLTAETGQRLRMRIGLNTGPVVAGVIGTRKFAYDLWGDTVNLASRMEDHAPPGGILVTAATHDKLRDRYRFRPAGLIQVKGRGQVVAHSLLAKK